MNFLKLIGFAPPYPTIICNILQWDRKRKVPQIFFIILCLKCKTFMGLFLKMAQIAPWPKLPRTPTYFFVKSIKYSKFKNSHKIHFKFFKIKFSKLFIHFGSKKCTIICNIWQWDGIDGEMSSLFEIFGVFWKEH